MSASNEWTDFHLTQKGWIQGTEKLDSGITRVSPPENRLLTRRYKEFIASHFSPLEKSFMDTWKSEDEDKVKKYLQKFPYPYEYYKGFYGSSL